MKPSRRRLWLRILPLVFLALGAAVYFGREKLLWGYTRFAIYRMTSGLPRCDRAEIYLLGIREHNRPNDPSVSYPTSTRWDGGSSILDSKKLSGADAEKLAAIWRSQSFSYEEQGLCHEPVYGLRLFSGTRLRFEGTLCFHCHNFYADLFSWAGIYWGFDADNSVGKELWNELDAVVPYALRKPLEDALMAEKQARRAAKEAGEPVAPFPYTSGQKP